MGEKREEDRILSRRRRSGLNTGGDENAIGSWLTMKIRTRQESLDRTFDLLKAFQKFLIRFTVRIRDIVSQGEIPPRGRIRVEQWKQENFPNMVRESFSHERGLAMLHREDHVGVLDHVRRDRLRPVIHQLNTPGFRDPCCEIRRRSGHPHVKTR